jgi:hypothetical protein
MKAPCYLMCVPDVKEKKTLKLNQNPNPKIGELAYLA